MKKNRSEWIFKAKAVMLAMRVIPRGADQPLPPLPIEPVDPESKSAQRLWDRLMPKYRGLLDAKIKGKRRFEE